MPESKPTVTEQEIIESIRAWMTIADMWGYDAVELAAQAVGAYELERPAPSGVGEVRP